MLGRDAGIGDSGGHGRGRAVADVLGGRGAGQIVGVSQGSSRKSATLSVEE